MGRRHYRRDEIGVCYTVKRQWYNLTVSPWLRVEDSPSWGRLWALVGGFFQLAISDVFTGILVLVIVSAFADYFFGRKVAERQGLYDPVVAQFGLHSKMSGFLVLLLIRFFEAWLSSVNETLDTHGVLATGIAVLLFAQDVESIAYHRRQLGSKPMPGLAQVLSALRATGRAFLPDSLHDDPKEHEDRRRRHHPTPRPPDGEDSDD